MHNTNSGWLLSRRDFLKASGTAIAAASSWNAAAEDAFRFGLVTDLHYADSDMRMGRYYQESIAKLRECVDRMNEAQVSFVCELGDFKDEDMRPEEARTLSYLETIEAEYARLTMPRHYVFGNHDLDSISKEQFMERTAMIAPYHSFDAGGYHFVVLDSCFDKESNPYDHGKFSWQDTNVPAEEIAWLQEDLAATTHPTIVFGHQRLDDEGPLYVNNSAEVRGVLEESGKVLAVFTGHDHPGGHNLINGVHYYTLIATVEGSGEVNNSYAIVEVAQNGDIVVEGYRRAVHMTLAAT